MHVALKTSGAKTSHTCDKHLCISKFKFGFLLLMSKHTIIVCFLFVHISVDDGVFVSITKKWICHDITFFVCAIKWCNICLTLVLCLFIYFIFLWTWYTWIRRAGILSGYRNRVTIQRLVGLFLRSLRGHPPPLIINAVTKLNYVENVFYLKMLTFCNLNNCVVFLWNVIKNLPRLHCYETFFPVLEIIVCAFLFELLTH